MTKVEKSPDSETRNDEDIFIKNVSAEGEGRIILASSETISRDIVAKHENEQEQEHFHGIFTFYLIEGLDGKASETGMITLDGLQRYVDNELSKNGKQRPLFFTTNSSQMGLIKIAVASQQYNKYIHKKLKEAEYFYSQGNLSGLIRAIPLICDVLNISAKNTKALDLKNKISESLTKCREKIVLWLINNELTVKPRIPNVFQKCKNLIFYMHFDKIITLDSRNSLLLLLLWEANMGEIYDETFITICKRFDDDSTHKPK